MTPEAVESLLECSRPTPPPPQLRARILEIAGQRTPSLPASARKPRLMEVTTMAASILTLLATQSWLLLGPTVPTATPGQPFEERRLAENIDVGRVKEFGWSADGKHWACIASDKKDEQVLWVVIDGKREKSYSDVTLPIFGADGHSAYIALDLERGSVLMIDGKIEEHYRNHDAFAWSPDGKKLAYTARKDDQKVVVVEGLESQPYDDVWQLQWAPDGSTVFYAAKLQSDWFCVVNGKKGEVFDAVRDLQMLPDGKTLAYCAYEGDWAVVIGTRRHAGYPKIGAPAFSADGKTMGYVAENDDVPCLIIGPVAGGPVTKFGPAEELGPPAFNRDGTVWAYRKKVGKESVVVGRSAPGQPALATGDPYDQVSDPVLNPDGTIVAYSASTGARQYLVVGEQKAKKFSLVDRISFGPDGKTVAFRAGAYAKQLVVAGESRSGEYDEVVSGPVWSADGRKVAFTARSGAELWSHVLELK